jgi:hypothetical protein
MQVSIVLFALGSGIAGGASTTAMLIVGGTIQGLGAGGIQMLVELIVCDLVSPKQCARYLGIVTSSRTAHEEVQQISLLYQECSSPGESTYAIMCSGWAIEDSFNMEDTKTRDTYQ